MQIQHQKGMPPTILKDPINDHMTYSVTKKIIPFFAYSHCKETRIYLLPL